jgi:Tfp pilus assembly protein PilN
MGPALSPMNALLRPRLKSGIWLLVLATGLLSAAFYFFIVGERFMRETASLRQRTAALQQPRYVPPPPSRTEMEMSKRWDALALERGFRWYPLFVAIETASIDDIELFEFEPDKPGRTLILRGEARNMDALIAYLDQLAKQAPFRSVHLTHQEKKARDSLSTVSFEVQAALN